MVLPAVDGTVVVFGLIGVTLVLFVTEAIPNDMTAVGVIVTLAALEPVTGVSTQQAISGFSNTATITIVAMFMLSAGIQQTGLVQRLGVYLARLTRGSEGRALAATVGATGPLSGFLNNTPVVAVFIPMITDLARQSGISPSKLLLPLSYAAILGGTLTLIGTATNLLASQFATDLPGRGPIGMFEFSALGVVILLVGVVYLLTVGRRLTPARIPADADLVEQFDLEDHLARLRVDVKSPVVGKSIGELEDQLTAEVKLLQLRRGDQAFVTAETDQRIAAGDTLLVHGTIQAVTRVAANQQLRNLTREGIEQVDFDETDSDGTLATAVVPEGSAFAGERLLEIRLPDFHGTQVLAIRREGTLIQEGLSERRLRAGDVVLIQTTPTAIEYFGDTGNLVVATEAYFDRLDEDGIEAIAPLSPRAPVAVAIMAGVIGTAAIGLVPIVIAALGGVVLMVVTGCLTTREAYDAVSWNIIFLLAGVIPLGIALETTGGSELVADRLVATANVLPPVAVMVLFAVVTGLFANVITPVATIILMTPIALDAAGAIGARQFSFLLVVMFASATSFMTPVGYQTNLMVYGPGGYTFTDFLRVGAPLQLLLAFVVTAGVSTIWGI